MDQRLASIFSSMFLRRQDYAAHLRQFGGGSSLVGRAYFQAARQLMQQRQAAPVFVVLSDDPDWSRYISVLTVVFR